MHKRKAVFLDRDGTIIVDFGYTYSVDQLEFIPKSIEALQLFHKLGYLLIIISNQSGIGRGYYKVNDYERFKAHMSRELARHSISIDSEFFCPHRPEDQCSCRKPKILYFKQAIEQYDIDPKQSFMIGDKTEDIKAADNIGIKSILVKTGKGGQDNKYIVKPYHIANNLYEASIWVQQNYR